MPSPRPSPSSSRRDGRRGSTSPHDAHHFGEASGQREDRLTSAPRQHRPAHRVATDTPQLLASIESDLRSLPVVAQPQKFSSWWKRSLTVPDVATGPPWAGVFRTREPQRRPRAGRRRVRAQRRRPVLPLPPAARVGAVAARPPLPRGRGSLRGRVPGWPHPSFPYDQLVRIDVAVACRSTLRSIVGEALEAGGFAAQSLTGTPHGGAADLPTPQARAEAGEEESGSWPSHMPPGG